MDMENIVWLCLLSVFVHADVFPKGQCQRRQNGRNIIYCCQNYVNTSEGCKECRDGFTTTDGITCFPCTIGRYGRRCMKICACNYNESCDHIHGCVQSIQTLAEDRNGLPTSTQIHVKHDNSKETSTYQKTTASTYHLITSNNVTTTGKHNHSN